MKVEVLSVGEVLVEVIRGRVGEPLERAGEFFGPYPSGAPAIFIDAVARLGHRAGIIGAVGDDDFGKCIIERLQRDEVDLSSLKILKGYPTGVAFVTYFQDGGRKFLYHIPYAAAGRISSEDVVPDYVEQASLLHLMGSSLSVNEIMRNACLKALRIAEERGMKVTFDPNLRPELLSPEEIRRTCFPVIEVSYAVMPSREEIQTLTGETDLDKAALRILKMGPRIVALKKGSKGSTIYTFEERIDVPPFQVKEVDPTGAGDVFDAGFVVGLLEGWDLKEVGRFANAVGAFATTRRGPMEGIYTREEIEEFLKRAS